MGLSHKIPDAVKDTIMGDAVRWQATFLVNGYGPELIATTRQMDSLVKEIGAKFSGTRTLQNQYSSSHCDSYSLRGSFYEALA